MPFLDIGKAKIFYRLEGNPGSFVLVLSHSIGTDHGMWAPQVSDLVQHFQILRYDTRGHGASDAPARDYSIEQLGGDVLGLTDALGIRKFAFCGLSLGGAIGQWLAVNAPDRIERLILANSAPKFGSREQWETRIRMVKSDRIRGVLCRAARIRFERISQKHFCTHPGYCRTTGRFYSVGGQRRSTCGGNSRRVKRATRCGSFVQSGAAALVFVGGGRVSSSRFRGWRSA